MADRETRKDGAQRQDISMKRNASVPFSFSVACHLHIFPSHPFPVAQISWGGFFFQPLGFSFLFNFPPPRAARAAGSFFFMK